MNIRIGSDIVSIKKFKKFVERGGPSFLDKIFTPHELSESPSTETLAGIFAAKEAVIKALGMRAGEWRKIEIVKNKSGRPEIKLPELARKIVSHDISISHDGDYAFAVAIFLIKS